MMNYNIDNIENTITKNVQWNKIPVHKRYQSLTLDSD